MACEQCSGGKLGWSYDTVTKRLKSGTTCSGSTFNSLPCTDGTGSTCPSMCAGCGGIYYTIDGSGVITCYTNVSCGSVCSTVDELGALGNSARFPWMYLLIVPVLVLVCTWLLKLRKTRLTLGVIAALCSSMQIQAAPPDLNSLIQKEKKLISEFRALPNGGYSAASAASQLKAGKAEALEKHRAVDAKWLAFHNHYDEFTHAKLAFLLDRYLRMAQSALQHLPKDRVLEQHFANLVTAADNFNKVVSLKPIEIGDASRLSDSRHFAEELVLFWDRFAKIQWRWRDLPAHWEQKIRRLRNVFHYALVFGPHYVQAKRRLDAGAPLLEFMAPLFQSYLNRLGYNQSFRQGGNLHEPLADGTVRIFAPNHIHGVLDAAMTCALPLDQGTVMNAPTFWASPAIAKSLQNHPEFTCVSNGTSGLVAISQMLKKVKDGTLKRLFIQAEGSLSTGLAYEVRRPAQNFVQILSKIRAQGVGIELIPISLPRHYRPFQDISHTSPSQLLIDVHEPVGPAVVELLLDSGDPQMLSRLLRQFWIDSFSRDSSYTDRPLGSPRMQSLVNLLDTYIAQRSPCAAELLETLL